MVSEKVYAKKTGALPLTTKRRKRLPLRPVSVSATLDDPKTSAAFTVGSTWVNRQKVRYKKRVWLSLCCGGLTAGAKPAKESLHRKPAAELLAGEGAKQGITPETLFALFCRQVNLSLLQLPGRIVAPFVGSRHYEVDDLHLEKVEAPPQNLEDCCTDQNYVDSEQEQKEEQQKVSPLPDREPELNPKTLATQQAMKVLPEAEEIVIALKTMATARRTIKTFRPDKADVQLAKRKPMTQRPWIVVPGRCIML